MAHIEHSATEEKKSVNFFGPLIGGLVVWLIILIIETNLDEPCETHPDNASVKTEQIDAHHE